MQVVVQYQLCLSGKTWSIERQVKVPSELMWEGLSHPDRSQSYSPLIETGEFRKQNSEKCILFAITLNLNDPQKILTMITKRKSVADELNVKICCR